MIRGTTAGYKFKLPCKKGELAWATIKFKQQNNPNELLPITKKLANCHNPDDSNELCVSLTAEETARFLDKYKATVQFRAQNSVTGAVFGIKERYIKVYPMDDSIIEEDPMIPSEDEEGWVIFDGDTIG